MMWRIGQWRILQRLLFKEDLHTQSVWEKGKGALIQWIKIQEKNYKSTDYIWLTLSFRISKNELLGSESKILKTRNYFRKFSSTNKRKTEANYLRKRKIEEVLDRFERKEKRRKKSQDILRHQKDIVDNKELENWFQPSKS